MYTYNWTANSFESQKKEIFPIICIILLFAHSLEEKN